MTVLWSLSMLGATGRDHEGVRNVGRTHARGRRYTARMLATLCVVGVAAATGGCGGTGGGSGSGGSAATKEDTWVHGILKPKGDSGYQLMAKERKYYKKQGINVELKEFVGNVQLVQALVSGAIDSGDTAPAPIYDAVKKGSDLKIIGSTLPKITYALLTTSDIKTFKDLQGKIIGASAPGAFPDSVTKAMLAEKGMDPNSVKVVSAGSDAQRFKALLSGRIDAAAVSDQFVPDANKNPKIRVLGEAQNIIPQYPRFYLMANNQSLQEKPDAAVKFLAGEIQGLCYAVTHPKAERRVAAQHINGSPTDPQVVYVQQAIAKAGAASATSAITMSRLKWLQQFRIEQGFQKGKVNLSDLVDTSVREKALKQVDLPQKCMDDPNIEK